MRVILGGNFPGGGYPGWEFSVWELSRWELSWVGIFFDGGFPGGNCPGGIIRVGILLVGVFLVPQNSSFSSIRLFLVAFLKIISDFELFVLVFVYSREKVLAMKKHFY